jgi:rod shape-determining protein MreD
VRWVPFLLLAVVSVLLQTTVVRILAVGAVRPDLMVAVLVPLCLGARRGEGFAAGCVLGLLRDLFSSEPLGLSAGVFAALGYGLARLRPSVYAEHPLTHGILGFGCSCLVSGVSVGVLLAQGGALSLATVLRGVAVVALGTGVLAAAVGGVVWRRPRWFGLRRGVEFEDV